MKKIELITTLLRAVMMIFTIFVIPAVSKWMKANAASKEVQTLEKIVDDAVTAAEQLRKTLDILDPTGEWRKSKAVILVRESCRRLNIELSDAEIEMLIEAAVKNCNPYWHQTGMIKGKEVEA